MAAAIATTATTLEGQLLEVAMRIQALESDPNKNPDNRNFVTGTFNSDSRLGSGTYSLPVAMSFNTEGSPCFEAVEYLID